jgi:deltex-like protein
MSRARWEYSENGQWYGFDDLTTTHLEEQYIRQPYSTIKVPIFGAIFDINFSQMTRTDVRRNTTDAVRRVLPDNSIPSILNANQSKAIYVWHYNDNGYRKLDPQTNAKFERTFAKNPNAKFLISILQTRFIVDFSAMQLCHSETSSTHSLLRLDVSATGGFVAPKAINTAKRNIVAGKITSKTRIQLPSEKRLAELLVNMPTRPDFATWSLRTPDINLLKPSNNLPMLSPTDYEHKSSCAICFCDILHPKTAQNAHTFDDVEDYQPEYSEVTCFPCGHVYHHACAKAAVQTNPRCPACRQPISATFGLQPAGTMNVSYSNETLNGFKTKGMISINFNMDSGIQEDRHPNPGRSYHADSRSHFMPATANGFRALRWIAMAWLQFSMFAVGYSGTRNCDDVIIYAIHLKTSTSGGESGHGWPDKEYFGRLNQEIRDAGILIEQYISEYDDLAADKAPEIYLGPTSLDLEEL